MAAGARETDWGALGLGLGLGVLAAYEQFKLPPVLPLLIARYGHAPLLAGAFMSVFAAAGLVLSFAVGRVHQRRPRARLVESALVLFAAGGALALVLPQSGAAFLAARALEATGFGVIAVTAPVMVARAASVRHAPLALAAYAAWIPAGQIIATFFAYPVVAAGLWRPLWGLGIAASLALAAWLLVRGEGYAPRDGPREETEPPAAPGTRRALSLSAIVFALWSTQIIALLTWLPAYLVDAWGVMISNAALIYAVPAALIIVFNFAGGALLRAGAPLPWLLSAALLIQAAAWAVLPRIESAAAGLAALTVFSSAAGITPACLFALPTRIVGRAARASMGFGVLMTGRNLGVLVGPLALPELQHALGGWAETGPVFAAVTVAAALGAAALAPALRRLERAP